VVSEVAFATGAGSLDDLPAGVIAVLRPRGAADRTDGNDHVPDDGAAATARGRRSGSSEPSPGQQPGERASRELHVVDVHIVLVRVLEDGLE
jgi:hypothetical protein